MCCVELGLRGLAWEGKGLLNMGLPRGHLPDAGKGSAVCNSLHCGTCYLIAVLARPAAQVPRWAGNVSGGPGSIPGRFWRTGVPSFRRCSAEPLHSGSVKYRDVVRPLHRPLHYRVRGWGAPEKKNLPDEGKGPAVCSSLHCGTRYLIAVVVDPAAQVPRWAGSVSGGPGSIPGRFWRTGVPSFRRCSGEPLHSGSVKYRDVAEPIALPGPWAWAPKKKKKKNKSFSRSLTDSYAMLMGPSEGETAVHRCHCPHDMAVRMREVMGRPWVAVCVPLAKIYW